MVWQALWLGLGFGLVFLCFAQFGDVVFVWTGHAPEAVTYADRAVHAAPDSPDALAMLGFTKFASDHTADAIRAWKKSLRALTTFFMRATSASLPSSSNWNSSHP